MQVSAQVSLYPLRQESLSPSIEKAWKVFEEKRLNVEKGTMSTLISGEIDKVFDAIKEAFLKSAENGQVSMVVTLSNACPAVLERKT